MSAKQSEQSGNLTTLASVDDQVVPFQVDTLDVRGRAVQIGPMLNRILDGHQYPEPVARLLGEAIVLGVLLGSSLKFEGRFTIQTQSDGPVSFLVVDFKTPDAVRAYARYDAPRLAGMVAENNVATPALLGKGILAMTIDQGLNPQRYQGIVELDGNNFEEVAHQYFRQSEQIPTKIRLAIVQLLVPQLNGETRQTWRAGGLIAQFLPDAPERIKPSDMPGGDGSKSTPPKIDDAWLEAASLVATIGDDELGDPQLGSEKLLYRLFHERGVRVFPATSIYHKCSCSKEKIAAIIAGFSTPERKAALAASERPGMIVSKCEYCGNRYELHASEYEDL